ncbi:MAG: nucleotide exchange factor GrpE [Candidatus Thermoplasmatota archaeon]|nr:nucleotide exchange factor GrpE [Candidatus Thermoplasmatota archaeon]
MPNVSYYRSLKHSLSECSERVKVLEENIAEKEKTIQEMKEQNLRFSADLDNFQKRISEESMKLSKYASERIIRELLPVLDSLENVKDEGTLAIKRQIEQILQKEGLVAIDDNSKFDPNRHEAIGVEDGGEANTIKKVVRRGYAIGDRVIRPELVILNRGD